MQSLMSTNSVLIPSFQFERRIGVRDSRLVARAQFLRIIPEIVPHVLDDLWPTFWDFVFAGCERFKRELGIKERAPASGREVFQRVFGRACEENWNAITNSHREAWIWRAHFWTLEELHRLDPGKVSAAFPHWNLLPQGPLRRGLQRWSERWNLNADWCREHALVVLRRWLFNKGLLESFLHPHNPKPNPYVHPPKAQTLRWHQHGQPTPGTPNNWLKIIWDSTSLEALKDLWDNEYGRENWYSNVRASREILKTLVFNGSEPKRVIFKEFDIDGWNFLDESALQFRRKAGVAFRRYLAKTEDARLDAFERQVSLSDYRNGSNEFVKNFAWRDHTLKQFGERLDRYLATMNRRKKAAIAKHNLIEIHEKPKLKEHLRHTVRYQIPDRKQNALTLTKIAQRARLRESAISKAINECLILIGLQKRPDTRGGRKFGSKNSCASQILNSLGH